MVDRAQDARPGAGSAVVVFPCFLARERVERTWGRLQVGRRTGDLGSLPRWRALALRP